MALLTPGAVACNRLPAGVIEGGRGPSGIVAELKLPGAAERDNFFSQPVGENRG